MPSAGFRPDAALSKVKCLYPLTRGGLCPLASAATVFHYNGSRRLAAGFFAHGQNVLCPGRPICFCQEISVLMQSVSFGSFSACSASQIGWQDVGRVLPKVAVKFMRGRGQTKVKGVFFSFVA